MDDTLLLIEPGVDTAYEASLVKVVPPDDPGDTGLGDPRANPSGYRHRALTLAIRLLEIVSAVYRAVIARRFVRKTI